jgi:hypothetical protein
MAVKPRTQREAPGREFQIIIAQGEVGKREGDRIK